MAERPKIAFYWCAGCGGCEESVIDLAEELIAVAQKAHIVFWPLALDARYRDIESLDDGEIDAAFINGAIRLDAHVNRVQLLRRKSKCIIAHGACAHMGGVIGLANLFTPQQLLECAYQRVPSMAKSSPTIPGRGVDGTEKGPPLPELLPAVTPLDRVIAVDAVIPGCPPPAETMARVIEAVIDGHLPGSGTVFANQRALCHECPRRESRPQRIEVKRFMRLHETLWDPDVCFLPQGLICLGPVTRGGCNARCIGANMPCRGCFGPTQRMDDFGAGAVSLIAAVMADGDEAALEKRVGSIADPTGLFYRYALASSTLGRGRIP